MNCPNFLGYLSDNLFSNSFALSKTGDSWIIGDDVSWFVHSSEPNGAEGADTCSILMLGNFQFFKWVSNHLLFLFVIVGFESGLHRYQLLKKLMPH